MFNDRDIAVIGAGAILSVMCLLLPVAFPWKIAAGFFTLVASMVAALIRLGGDGLTLEDWLIRRIRYKFRPTRWTFHIRDLPKKARQKKDTIMPQTQAIADAPPLVKIKSKAISWQRKSVRIEPLLGILLIVLSIFFLEWLRTGGAAMLGFDIGGFLQ